MFQIEQVVESIAVKGIERNSASVLQLYSSLLLSVSSWLAYPILFLFCLLSVVDFFPCGRAPEFFFFVFEFDAKNRSAFCLT